MKKYLFRVILSAAKNLALMGLVVGFFACGDDSGSTSASGENSTLSSAVEDDESSSSINDDSSSSVIPGSSSSVILSDSEGSSSSVKGSDTADGSSSSVIPDPDRESSSSSVKSSSSSAKSSSSSSEITDYVGLPCEGILSDGNTGKIYLCVDGRYVLYVPTESSSSGPYEPFDQTLPLERLSEKYKTFTDSRNGRVYYYLTIVGRDTNYVKDSIQVMAQNLNIADVTLKGGENMTDDTKIERYCYNDDTTKCDRYGGLYQWAEMMGFNDSCNTRSCAHLIQENHQGICPKGWRIMNINDFQIALTSTDDHANGLRSGYIFSGSNKSGLSLTGSGAYFNQGGFADLDSAFYMFYPSESVFQDKVLALDQVISRYNDGAGASRGSKFDAHSVRCIKLK